MKAHVPTSVVLRDLLENAPAAHVSLAWLMGSLRERSFGIVMLVLALVGLAPGVSAVAGVVLAILAFQMIVARPSPVFPRLIAARQLRTRQLERLVNRALPVLTYLEKLIHPRWYTPFAATKRVVGVVILLLGMTLLIPIPLSNIVPSLIIMLIAFAYLEEDGMLLCAALVAALALLSMASLAVWGSVAAAVWTVRF